MAIFCNSSVFGLSDTPSPAILCLSSLFILADLFPNTASAQPVALHSLPILLIPIRTTIWPAKPVGISPSKLTQEASSVCPHND